MLTVFAYGTLKPGESGFEYYCKPYIIQAEPAYSLGTLFHLPQGYPAMTEGNRPVSGVLLHLRDEGAIAHIDTFEEYDPTRPDIDNLYVRQHREIFSMNHAPLGIAWIYLMTPERVKTLGGVLVESGTWSRQNWPSIAPVIPPLGETR